MELIRYFALRIFKKQQSCDNKTPTSLKKCLSTLQLTFIGIGSMVGSGIYILIGVATRNQAGPGVVISFILATLSSFCTSLCFAEFGSRIPKSGNPYVYVYYAYGELFGFLTGWSYVVGYLMSGALTARAWSAYFDSLIGYSIHNQTVKLMGRWSVGGPIADYPDLLAGFVIIIFVLLSLNGVEYLTRLSNVIAVMNCCILVIFIVIGFTYGSMDNVINREHGGFLPFGIVGVMQGATAAFFSFFGYETICIAAEESTNYIKSVPRALFLSLIITGLLYVFTAFSFTLLVPFYNVNVNAPFFDALSRAGLGTARTFLSIGPMCGLTTILLLNGFCISRLLFSMAERGLMWKHFAAITEHTETPTNSLLFCGILQSILAVFMTFDHLFKFYVIVSILTFSVVCFGITKVNYHEKLQPVRMNVQSHTSLQQSVSDSIDDTPYSTYSSTPCSLESPSRQHYSNVRFSFILKYMQSLSLNGHLTVIAIGTVIAAHILTQTSMPLSSFRTAFLLFTVFIIAVTMYSLTYFQRQPHHQYVFQVPYQPIFPILAGIVNLVFLVATFDTISFIGYVTVSTTGLFIYILICYHDMKAGK